MVSKRSAMGDLLGEEFDLVQKDNSVSLPRQAAGAQDGTVQFPAAALEDAVRGQVRGPALRFDQHVFRVRSARGRQATASATSRDKRSDCVQVVIALIVTPEGLPLAYEVMPGNTSDKTTLRDFLQRIEAQYGKAGRTWVMDRGIPTEAVLAEMRAAETPTHYLVGTPRGRLSQLEKDFLAKPWAEVRDAVQVKLVEQDGELYILARSGARRDKEQAMRRRRLKKLVKRLHELRQQKLTRDQLLIKLGAARKEAGPAAVADHRHVSLPGKDQPSRRRRSAFS